MKGKMNSDMDLPEPNYNIVQQADLMAELSWKMSLNCMKSNVPF